MSQPGRTLNMLTPESLLVFFRVLFSVQPLLSNEFNAELQHFYTLCTQQHAHLAAASNPVVTPAPIQATIQATTVVAPADEIDEEANSYFVKVYRNEVTVEDVIAVLKKFQNSMVERERKVFACMVQNLFQEYQFYEKYPDNELKITSVLFGSLLQQKLLTSPIVLGVSLRCIFEAIRKSPDSKLFRFGIWALDIFESRLQEWPQFCASLLQIPHLHVAYPTLAEHLNRISKNPSSSSLDSESLQSINSTINVPFDEYMQTTLVAALNAQASAVPSVITAKVEPVSSTTSAEITQPKQRQFTSTTKETVAIFVPDENTANKLHFLFNNVSKNNIGSLSNYFRCLYFRLKS